VSIDDIGKSLMDSTGMGAIDCGFVSRPGMTMLIKTLCIDEMWLGKKRITLGRCNGVLRADGVYDGNAYDCCGLGDIE
jgi:hypothetical protein